MAGRRNQLQVRLVLAMLDAEQKRGDPQGLRAFRKRANAILDEVVVGGTDDDPALVDLLAVARAKLAAPGEP